MFKRSPDTGGGVTVIVYLTVTLPTFGGGVHSMVTAEVAVPFTKLLSLTALGGPITIRTEIKCT